MIGRVETLVVAEGQEFPLGPDDRVFDISVFQQGLAAVGSDGYVRMFNVTVLRRSVV